MRGCLGQITEGRESALRPTGWRGWRVGTAANSAQAEPGGRHRRVLRREGRGRPPPMLSRLCLALLLPLMVVAAVPAMAQHLRIGIASDPDVLDPTLSRSVA